MDEIVKTTQNNYVDDLKLEMAYTLCDELQSAQALFIGHALYKYISKFIFDTRVQLKIIFRLVVVMAEKEEAHEKKEER